HADTHRRMGDCFIREGKMEQAEAMYRKAIGSNPYPDAVLYFLWGRTLEDTGQKQSAVAAFQTAARIDPTNQSIQIKLRQLGIVP
ncbi:MAG TPA: tetratricopeptide repeat protein, partial [Terriglobia bacterium]|nr:tetratricopeptide repeat protein [Terriglobia bacterium]